MVCVKFEIQMHNYDREIERWERATKIEKLDGSLEKLGEQSTANAKLRNEKWMEKWKMKYVENASQD